MTIDDETVGCGKIIAERDKLRAALIDLYHEFSRSNDFRPDSRVARNAREALKPSP